MTGFVLKIIGTIAMVLGHLSYTDEKFIIPLYYIGKIALPLFAFLIVEGYVHTRSFKKYLTRILVFAVIAQVPFYFFTKTYAPDAFFFSLNTLFTFAVGLIALKLLDIIKGKFKKRKAVGLVLGVIPGIILATLAEYFSLDFGFLTIILMLIFYLLRKHRGILVWVYTLFVVAYLGRDLIDKNSIILLETNSLRNLLFQLLGFEVAMGLASMYNGKRGKDGKNVRLFFYFFYPIHFVLLLIFTSFIK